MSYTTYFKSLPVGFPTGIGAFAAGWLYLNVFNGRPSFGTREISIAEYKATPLGYLQHPDHHPTRLPKVPGQKDVPDARGELYHKAHHKDPVENPHH